MADTEFLESIYKVAQKAKKGSLTSSEKELIIKEFNESTGSAYDRATKAITKIVGVNPELILEKAATLDDINRLLSDLKMEAQKWQSSK